MPTLYLIERIEPQILGRRENREDVGRVLAKLGRALGDDAPFRQIGTWLLVGMTGRWPLCLGLWEMQDGWQTFASMVDRTMHSPDPALAEVYERMQGIRTGGVTMILQPSGSSPSFAEAIAQPDKGDLMVYEEAQVAPGTENDYLSAVYEMEVPRRAAHGTTLIGLYQGTATEGQTIAMWQTTSDGYASGRREGPTSEWLDRARAMRTSWREELWIAAPESRFARLGAP